MEQINNMLCYQQEALEAKIKELDNPVVLVGPSKPVPITVPEPARPSPDKPETDDEDAGESKINPSCS